MQIYTCVFCKCILTFTIFTHDTGAMCLHTQCIHCDAHPCELSPAHQPDSPQGFGKKTKPNTQTQIQGNRCCYATTHAETDFVFLALIMSSFYIACCTNTYTQARCMHTNIGRLQIGDLNRQIINKT